MIIEMKKIIVVLLMSCMMVLVIAGCGSMVLKNWNVTVLNEAGNPVEGVEIQLCTDTQCTMVTTDADGHIDFDGKESQYDVHLSHIPEGYEYNGTELVLKKGEELYIVLSSIDNDPTDNFDATTPIDDEDMDDSSSNDSPRIGDKLVFSTVDRFGNIYDESIFAEYKVTMINIWEPWCGPCIEEMPDIEQLYQEKKDKGFLVLGVFSDYGNLESVIQQTGVNYPLIERVQCFDNIAKKTGAVPTTVFVDSEGYILAPSEAEKEMVKEDYCTLIQENIECYQAGLFDEYLQDERYAEIFELLNMCIEDPSYMDIVAQEEIDEISEGIYEGSASYEEWKQRIEFRLN